MNDGDKQTEDTNKARATRPTSQEFKDFLATGWAEPDDARTTRSAAAPFAAVRRERLSAMFPGKRIVVPAGELKVRANDTDYRFRPSSDFAYLTGLGADNEPSAVLVMEPRGTSEVPQPGHDATLYLIPPAGHDDEGFYADPRSGEFWIGRRPGLAEFEAMTGIATAPLADLPKGLRLSTQPSKAIHRALSEMRFVKDAYEIQQLRDAVDATIDGFARAVSQLPRAIEHKRGERVVEAAFDGHAREEGNAVGYETIAASGAHATTLHWISNDGQVRRGDLLLLDAGVEVESLYTADITRTLPVEGQFTPVQRKVYEVVLEAADAGFAVARPGARFLDVHMAAMEVIEKRLTEWGIVPDAKDPEAKLYRRWMVHPTSHHLGLDVHDCAAAKRELYMEGVLEPGMVFTIEPGLYFKADDLIAPAELRGIGIRIEDDVLVTEDGCENLSAALPRDPDAVEAWMARLQGSL
ncbi:aminopeptidase P family protein [Demequina sp. TTPB684]|uniref:aminopeptidase P family protein n=1 Tax=unclassified Demequina TaxID=2620311 RepID=UPI001CF15331|nr:aminopeptidase P family protein [Demequina sp. TMPB413]MCB2412336.1 aminopeptidase P family protein [Demequina sp. TTPB684]UPU88511.1 aminopeptidase P family protein [Demequina sp. TMPB413]